MGDTAPVDETRRLTPVPSDSWLPPLLKELPRITLGPSPCQGDHVSQDNVARADLIAQRVLGEGGMGVVTLCRQRSLARDVAVKTVRPGDGAPGAIRALVEEARITGSLEHPGIVPVHSLGVGADEMPALVMKCVTGVTWRDMVRDAEHPAWAKVKGDRLAFHLDVLRRVCDAVHFAHSRGVMHRDLKTANVMIGDYGEVYVLDWGLACAVGDCDSGTEHVIGTPAFMAPEMLSRGAEPLTIRADVYLLGGMLHEVLTGRPRHEGTVLLQVLHRAWASEPYEYPASVPRELAELCNRATHRDPDQRPADVRAFADALVTYEEHQVSERFVDAALERLEALRALVPGGEAATAQRLWVEASFAFHQAIEAWPDNPRALTGRREGTVWMVCHELACRNVVAAEALLSTLASPPEELHVELSRVRGELASEASEVARLRQLDRDMDTRVSAWERARASIFVVGAAAAMALGFAVLESQRMISLTHGSMAAVLLAVASLAAVATWRWRDVLLANRIGRELIAMPFVALAGALASLWVGVELGLSPGASAVVAMLVTATVFGAMAVAIDRRLFAVSATVLGATFAGAAFPTRALEAATFAALCASIEVALLFRSIAR